MLLALCLVGSPLPPPAVRWEGGRGGGGAVAPGGVGDSAASFPVGVAVAWSSRSQESLVLAAPSLVASSVTEECDRRLRSREIGGSAEARSCSCFSQSSPSRKKTEMLSGSRASRSDRLRSR